MQPNNATLPRTSTIPYLFIRIVVRLTTTLLLLSLGAVLPLILAGLNTHSDSTREHVLELVFDGTLLSMRVLLIGLFVAIGVLFISLLVYALTTGRHRQSGHGNVAGARKILVRVLFASIVIVCVLALIGPAVGNGVIFGYGQCSPLARVISFIDQNRNGSRDADEAMLAHVKGTFSVSTFADTGYTDKTLPFETDESGRVELIDPADVQAAINQTGSAPSCMPKLLTLNVDVPAGYTPTTRTNYGPYRWENAAAKANVAYVGFVK